MMIIIPKGLIKGLGDLAVGEYQDNSIIKIGQNREKSPGDLRKLAITQIPMNYYQLTLVWNTLKGIKLW